MGKITDISYDELEAFWAETRPLIAAQGSLQGASQVLADELYKYFEQSIILTRIFATVAFRLLPQADRVFVEKAWKGSPTSPEITDETIVLSLLGTCGIEADWRRRECSKDHLGIPLFSEGHVGEIPMIARLLNEIGFRPNWTTSANDQFVTKSLANVNGIFFVADARSATDERGRLVIPAQKFVERYGVRTVFGFGGSFLAQDMFITVIVFSRELLLRSDIVKFSPTGSSFKAATTRLVNREKIF